MREIDVRELWAKLEALILDRAADAIPGKDKMRAVVHEAAVWCAKKTPLPDWLEIPVYTMALQLLAQAVFDRLRDAARV